VEPTDQPSANQPGALTVSDEELTRVRDWLAAALPEFLTDLEIR
jgi:hypothetical protein